MKHLTLIKVRTADPAWLLYNISVYKNRLWKIKNWDHFLERLVSPCSSLSHSGWVSIWSAEPTMLTNYAWASKIWLGIWPVSPLLRENGRTPVAYISGASFLSWSFIGLLHKPSYSASFLHWIFLLSYPHSITLYIFDEYLNSRQSRLPFEYPGSAWAGPRHFFIFKLPFCGLNVIDHFLCSKSFAQYCLHWYSHSRILCCCQQWIPLSVKLPPLMGSYVVILCFLRNHCLQARCKVLSTCISSIIVVIIPLVPCTFVYLRPSVTLPVDKAVAV